MLKLFSAVALLSLFVCNRGMAADSTMLAQFSEGGAALVVIVLLSILFVSVSVERLLHFREKHVLSQQLVFDVKALWTAGEIEKIHHLLEGQSSTLAQVLRFILNNRHQSFAFISAGASELASLELRQHQQKAYALAIVATVAPIVGLLGTVIGMIEAFHVIAYAQGMGNPALLAGGISKALINTAAGLSVALPALAMHHFLKHRNALLGLALEKMLNQLLNEWFVSPPLATTSCPLAAFDKVAYAN